MRFLGGGILLAGVMAAAMGGAAWAEGNVADGSAVFQEQCAMCHGTTPGAVGVGPSLFGIYGKLAAGVPGYDFSPALMASHLTLDAAGLDKFLTSPQTAVPGTKMPYEGMTDAGQRADVIAYLASLK